MPETAILIRGGELHDGLRMRGTMDVLVSDGRVASIGLDIEPPRDCRVIDSEGLLVGPGLIDVHNMTRNAADLAGKDGVNLLSQGVTTVVVGNCGMSGDYETEADISLALAAFGSARPSLNVACLLGYSSLLRMMGNKGADSLGQTQRAIATGFSAGAIGVSLGLMYAEGDSQSIGALRSVATAVGTWGGVLAVHVRDEGPNVIAAMDEAISLSEHCRVVILHLKVCGPEHWSKHRDVIDRVVKASRDHDLFATCYPYGSTNTALAALLPDAVRVRWMNSESIDTAADEALVESAGLQTLALNGWDGVFLSAQVDDEIAHRSLGELAERWSLRPYEAYRRVLGKHPAARAVFKDVANEADMLETMRLPITVPASDGYIFDSSECIAEHPRNYGAIVRSLTWLLESGVSIEDALIRVTSRPAAIYGLSNRGVIEVGSPADIAILDPHSLTAGASAADPCKLSEGVVLTMISGEICFQGGQVVGPRVGQLLRRTGS